MSASEALYSLTPGYFSDITHHCLLAHFIDMIFSCKFEYITLIPPSETSSYCPIGLKYFTL